MVLHFNKIESHSTKDVCAKIVLNRPSGSGEQDFLILSMYFSLFRNYFPLEKGGALI